MKSKPRWMNAVIKSAKAEADAPKSWLKAVRKSQAQRFAEPNPA